MRAWGSGLLLLLVGSVIGASPAGAGSLGAALHLDSLPHGADVTLPQPATTLVGVGATVRLSATDAPQTISFAAIGRDGLAGKLLKVAIFDSAETRVKYVTVKPGTPFLYSLRGLETITVRAEFAARQTKDAGSSDPTRLRVESDKPLQVAH